MYEYFIMISIVLSIGAVYGIFTKRNMDKRRKAGKKLSKKQKREMESQ